MSEFGSGSYPRGMMPSKQLIAPEDGPYAGEAYDGDYVRSYGSSVEAKKLDIELSPSQQEGLWEQALDDAAHTGDYTPAHQYELNARLTAEQTKKEELFTAVTKAQTELQSAASFLITEAIGEGEPSRDITSHPDYIEANAALISAQSALEAYTKGVSPEI